MLFRCKFDLTKKTKKKKNKKQPEIYICVRLNEIGDWRLRATKIKVIREKAIQVDNKTDKSRIRYGKIYQHRNR